MRHFGIESYGITDNMKKTRNLLIMLRNPWLTYNVVAVLQMLYVNQGFCSIINKFRVFFHIICYNVAFYSKMTVAMILTSN